MSTTSQDATPGYAWPPSVVGFDMPSPVAGTEGEGEPVMVAFLSNRPDHYWVEAFVSEVGEFKSRHKLLDVRIDYRCLVIAGSQTQLRHLTTELRNFVQRVSRISLQRRVMDRLAPRDASTPSDADHAAAVRDVNMVAHMPGIAAILEAVSRETGMRFATVARVTDTRWTACAVYDTINFGLHAGQDLALETTICNEIRQHGRTVVFNHASTHPVYSRHPTPALYGFESYISVPIYRANGQLFGTLCAVDPEPRQLDPATVQSLEKFARAIGEEIDRADVPWHA
ncbi:MAG TPA: GAF domain-containing protein [Dyella sp.]|uniref:GAF domain-containing protein n=1 Tax=Dyella sp. TaxID=1869338 RepID=UPI002D77EADA|nr:GAF domain-containing protein [Dyella sp.]HET6555269.1 GAF domain-containing protein [Dyella sp.]